MSTGSTRKSEFIVPADLGPNDAHELREDLLAWLQTKRSRGKIELGGDPDDASISALQLVISATRSEVESPPVLGAAAERAVAVLTVARVLEHGQQ